MIRRWQNSMAGMQCYRRGQLGMRRCNEPSSRQALGRAFGRTRDSETPLQLPDLQLRPLLP